MLRFTALIVVLFGACTPSPSSFPTVDYNIDFGRPIATRDDLIDAPDMVTPPDLHGTCGMGDAFIACHFPHAGSMCVNGECRISGCDLTHEDCNADPSDGCETETDSNRANCGACGNACVTARNEYCVEGQCVIVDTPDGGMK